MQPGASPAEAGALVLTLTACGAIVPSVAQLDAARALVRLFGGATR